MSKATKKATGAKRKREEEAPAATPAAPAAPVEVEEELVNDSALPTCAPWPLFPSEADAKARGWGVVSPAITGGFSKMVVGLQAEDPNQTWAAASAILAIHAASQKRTAAHVKANPGMNVVVVVAKDLISASAVAWAARCRNVPVACVFSTSDEDLRKTPDEHFGDATLVVVSKNVFIGHGNKKGSSPSYWMSGRTVVVMPGVDEPEDYQPANARAVFFTEGAKSSESLPAKSSKKGKKETATEEAEGLAATHNVAAFGKGSPVESAILNDESGEVAKMIPTRFDNEALTAMLNGNLQGAMERVVEVFNSARARCEDVLTAVVLADQGSMDGTVSLAHHKLAYILGFLCDEATKMHDPSVKQTLNMVAGRAVARAIRLLPQLTKDNCPTVGGMLANLYLQATLCQVFPQTSAHVVDALGAAWGMTGVVEGMSALDGFNKKRADQVHRVRTRWEARLGARFADFMVILMHFVSNLTAGWSMTRAEVATMIGWDALLAHKCGKLETFLLDAMLVPPVAGKGAPKGGGAQADIVRPQQGMGSKIGQEGKKVNKMVTSMPVAKLPIIGTQKRKNENLEKMALEEILSAMPRTPVPMYIGDVGQLIGIWSKFNAKYQGALPTTLSQFLEKHDDHFKVVKNVVVRLKAGATEAVRVRYDDHTDGDDSDDDNKGGLGGAGKRVHHKKKRRLKLQETNRKHFDKNHKSFDPESRVPGYVKHAHRAVKGRGRKANIRSFKKGK